MAELVDALVLGTSANGVGVRVPSSAPKNKIVALDENKEINCKSWFFCIYIVNRYRYWKLKVNKEHHKYKKNSFNNWYIAFLYLLDLLLPQKKNIRNEKSKKSPEYYKAIKIMDEFSEENRTIGRLQLKNIKIFRESSKHTIENIYTK